MPLMDYSVLMSVYIKEQPDYLCLALESMLNQTLPPSEIVIVEDGTLTTELEEILSRYDKEHPNLFRIIRFKENHGLGYALNKGVLSCSNNIIVRMDTDDYAVPNRVERQLNAICREGFDIVGSQVTEFITKPSDAISISRLPEKEEEIRAYSKRRNPFRHPSIVYKKDKVLEAGNYSSKYLYFEDWDLFNRMIGTGCKAGNIHDPLVAMRVSEDFYERRGGIRYLRYAWVFKFHQFRIGYFTLVDLCMSFIPHMIVSLLPNKFRKMIYSNYLRDGVSND